MRSRTASESVRTSRPSTWAEPPLRGNRPVSILMTVVFPLPFGPRKPKISPFSTRKVTSLTAVKPPNLRTRCSAEMAARTGDCGSVAIVSARRFKFHVRGHPGEHAARRVVDADFYPEDLMDAFHFLEVGLRLKIARFGGGNLFATVPALHFIELVLGHLPLCEGHFPICFCGVPLLPGDQILFGETVVTVKVEPRADFIGFGAFQIVLRDINFLFAVTVLPQLIVRFGLSCGRARLGHFLRTVAALRLLRVA